MVVPKGRIDIICDRPGQYQANIKIRYINVNYWKTYFSRRPFCTMGILAYLFPFQPIRIQTCKHIVNILYQAYAGVPCPRPLPPTATPPFFTWKLVHIQIPACSFRFAAYSHSDARSRCFYRYPNSATLIQICSLYPFRSWQAHSDEQPIPIQMHEPASIIQSNSTTIWK